MATPNIDIQESFKESFNSLKVPAFILKHNGEIIFANNEAIKKFDDDKQLKAKLKENIQKQQHKEEFETEVEYNEKYFLFNYKKLTNQTLYLLQIEEILKPHQEADFHEIVENAHNAILRLDSLGNIKYINRYGWELFGYSPGELIGKNVIGTIISKIDSSGVNLLDKVDEIKHYAKEGILIENENITKDGKRLWMSWMTRAIQNNKDEIVEYISIGTDRTEKKKIKEQLIASEERFRRMFENSSLGIYQTTPEGTIVNINESFARMFGYGSVEEMKSEVKNISEQIYVNPNDRNILFQRLEEEPDHNAILEMDFKRKDGSPFVGYLHVRKVNNPSEKTFFYEGYIDDITNRKKADAELQHSRDKYKHLVEAIPYGIDEVNLEGYIIYNNSSLESMLGYESGELLGKHITELRPDGMSAKHANEFLKSVVKNLPKPERVFDRIRRKDNRIVDVQVDWDYLFDQDRNVTGFINIISDITERIAAENALKESEERFRSIYENSTLGIYRTTSQGKIILANPALYKLFGYKSFEEFKKKNAAEAYVDPNERKRFIDELNKKGYLNGFETKGKKRDGTLLYFRESARAIKNEHGEIVYYDGILEDFTDKKVIEKNLIKAKEEAEKADKLKSTFLANMSHEIRTPMNGIMGFSNLLSQPDIADETRMRYTKIIQSRGEDLLRIINDILDISKIEVNQLKLYQKEFSLNNFVDQLFEIYKQRLKFLEDKSVELKSNFPCRSDNMVLLGDETRIKQIITNYIDNSIKFTEKGFIEIGCMPLQGSKLQFYVKDTGIGIPDNMLEVIFERFRQNDETATRNYGGNGLGLAICKGLAKLMNGSVSAESKVNEGATFYLTLPVTIVKSPTAQKSSARIEYHWQNKKILLVEDDEVSATLIEELFENTMVTLMRAADGYSALRMVKEYKFDLVLLDIGLPDIDGLEVAKKMKESYPKLSIIAQTAFAMKDDENKCKQAGCDDYVHKPVVKDVLFEKINGVLK